jgi:hypothetical protein
MKRFVFYSDSDNLLTKKLMNYISNDKDISNNKEKDYDSLNVKNDKNIKIDNESSEKINKVVRFAEDYCRASPNISLKNKSLLNIGWRMQKYNYDVEYEIINYKGEKFLVYDK